MNRGVLKQKIKLHYKKYLSIIFSGLALAFMVSAIAYDLISYAQAGLASSVSFLSLLSYILIIVAFSLIFMGAVQGSNVAFSGIFTLIFYLVWDFVEYSMFGGFAVLGSSDWLSLVWNVLYWLFSISAAVIGIILYIRLRGYLSSKYSSYKGLRNLALTFMILVILTFMVEPIVNLYKETSFDVFFNILYPLGMGFGAIGSFFCVTRLKSEF